MPLRAVLFDFGGTLLDMATDDEAHRRAFAWTADAWRLPVAGDALWRQHMEYMEPYWHGQPGAWRPLRDLTRESFERLLREYGRDPTDDAWDRFWRAYLAAHRDVMRPYPDAEECLDRIAALGVHVGVLSDVDIDFLDFALGVVGLRDRFDSITTSEEAGVGKPNPQAFRLALQKAGAPASETAYVGDSARRDVEGARAVGMRALHVVRTGEPSPAADGVARDLREAAAILEGWAR
jgi:2-haloalkanoic acid dehalogenase type II